MGYSNIRWEEQKAKLLDLKIRHTKTSTAEIQTKPGFVIIINEFYVDFKLDFHLFQ